MTVAEETKSKKKIKVREGGKRRTPLWGRVLDTLVSALCLWILASAVAPFVHTDNVRLGMLFSYPPRVVYLGLSIGLMISFLVRKKWLRGVVSLTAAAFCVLGLGFGGGPRGLPDDHLTLLAFNVHDATDHVSDLERICREHEVDILVLQEVKRINREPFRIGLGGYEFFWGDRSEEFEYSHEEPFSSMIGIRRKLLESEPEIATAITGYRTFGARAAIRGQEIWVVNVHTTKAFWLGDGVSGIFARGARKALRHVTERDRLEAWLRRTRGVPVIVAGDWNAPHNSHNLHLPGMQNAQREVGEGVHFTFPRRLPLWGIDHAMGNQRIEFYSYKVLDAGFSDHRAQLVRFSVNP